MKNMPKQGQVAYSCPGCGRKCTRHGMQILPHDSDPTIDEECAWSNLRIPHPLQFSEWHVDIQSKFTRWKALQKEESQLKRHSPKAKHRVNYCCGKITFHTEKAALEAADEAGRDFYCQMFTYQCKNKNWHMTSQWQHPITRSLVTTSISSGSKIKMKLMGSFTNH